VEAGTGYPTSLVWDLPEGWTASEILWPTPKVVRGIEGAITGNGFEGVAFLPVRLTPPRDLEEGGSVTLRAKAEWLMCKESCMPGEAELHLTLPVRAAEPERDPTHGDAVSRAFASLPREVAGFSVEAARDGDEIVLVVRRADPSAAPLPVGLWFFAEDGFVQYDAPQIERVREADSVEIALRVSPAYLGDGKRLVGVLRTEGSWTHDVEPMAGLRIDVAWSDASTPLGVGGDSGSKQGGEGRTGGRTIPLVGTLGLALLGGAILNLMPCVFPVLGIKIMGFVHQAGADRGRVAAHGLVFSVGVLCSFWVLAGVLAVLRAGGDQLGWGFQLQSPTFVFALAVVMLVFALAMSGVFEFGLGATGLGARLHMREGLAGSFFTGVLATVVATPCSAPFLAPALGAALTLPVAASLAVFTAVGVGLSLPYLLLSLFPGAVRALPRPGAWMETFKQAMAFPLYATVGFLIWVLAGQVEEGAFLGLLFGLTTIAAGTWLYGRFNAAGASRNRARVGLFGGAALAACGAVIGWPVAKAPGDVVWERWSAAAVAEARVEGRPIYVDFTARWCATCQTNKRVVFASDEVKRLFREKNVLALRADWTNRDPEITAALAQWGRSAVPFNLVYRPGLEDARPLPELLTPGIVLDALR
jgi:thiol:disulfide interchange protein DsbD